MLDARIREARVYNRALKPDEVMASFGGLSDYVSQKELIAALPPQQRKEKDTLEERRSELEKKLQEYQSQGNVTGRGLQDIALALFNMKEFIYLK